MNHPPVVVHPQPGHGMPKPPAPPSHRIDPSRNGDNRAVHPPTRDNRGRPVTQHPDRDAHGRDIPPNRDHMGRIDRRDFRDRIHHDQDHWNDRDHDYHWHDWNGWRVCHHYDEFGFHWWGFYVGSVYFWTRYYNDNYWWYDPYFHRWVYMHEGQWWWTGPDGWIYVYNGGVYYRYQPGDGGVIMTPDPTPPVDVPPGDPTPAPVDQTSVYSLDGTRSIQITGDNRDAYLYDLTVADPQSPEAQGKYLASGVKSAAFVNDGNNAVLSIVLTVVDESGVESTQTFDRDGNPTDSIGATGTALPPTSDAQTIKTFQEKTQGSATLQSLMDGVRW